MASHRFDSIIALDEFDILLAAELREKYKIEGQNVVEAAVFRDKDVMTKRVKELGFRIPASLKVKQFSELEMFLNKHHDIIVKPISGAGSVDTFRIRDTDDLSVIKSKILTQNHEVLIQEYIDSDIYHIDGFMSNGKIIYCEPSKYLYNPLLIKKGISAAAVSLDKESTDYQRLTDYASLLSKKLYPKGTYLFHLEVFYDAQDILFLEIACRIGGARIRQNLEYKFEHSPLALLILSLSGEALPKLPEQYPNTAWLLTAKQAGTITELPQVTDEVKQHYSIFDYIEYAKIGQNLQNAYHSADAVIGLSLSGKNFEETRKKVFSVEKWLLEHTRYNK